MIGATSIRNHCERRLSGMKAIRQPYEAEWKEIASLAMPSRSRFLSESANKPMRQTNSKLRDSHGVRSFRILTGGMTSGLSSPSRPWFKLGTVDDDLMKSETVRRWLEAVEERMYEFFARSNFYPAAKTGYSELGLFGTEACVMVEHSRIGAVCHTLTIGEYWIACSDANMPDTLYRQVPMTVRQVVESFAKSGMANLSNNVRSAYDSSNYDMFVPVMHCIEPNNDRVAGMADAGNMPFRSVWWDETDSDKRLIKSSGFEEQPFWAPRWDTVGGDVYGSSPGMDVLADLRELQAQAKRKGQATDLVLYPPMMAPTGLSSSPLNLTPRGITYVAAVDAEAVKPIYLMPYQAISVIGEDQKRCQQAVDSGAYADMFMAITQMDGIQPRNVQEIAARNEEKLTQLGPVVERVNGEKLQIAIDRVFGIMTRTKQLPPPPEELSGQALVINFVSILTQMQRMVGAGAIERTAGFIGNFAASVPQALDKLNVDQTIDDYAEIVGAPPTMIRSDDEVEKLRADRQQQQSMAQAQQMAPAAKDGATAARLLSETDTGGGVSMLQKLAGG